MRVSSKDRIGAAPKPARKKKPKSSKKKTKKTFWLWQFVRFCLRPVPRLTYWGVVLGLWATIAVAGIFGYYAAQLPSAGSWAVPERPPNMRILASDDTVLGNRGLTGGTALRLEEMSPYIPQAVIAIEDRRFHAHFGFDPIGFTRAMSRNIMQGRMREGGSTLTQQLAKNLFLKPERTFARKVQELILSVWLETKYSKAEILELYLNRVYFGSGATGIDAASRRYFGKSAKHVTIAEAALLAGLLKAPSRYSPAKNPALAQQRARIVLGAMQREGYIKPGSIDFNKLRPGQHAKHFRSGPEHFVADLVAKRAAKILGKTRSDVIVETTISSYLMLAANSAITDTLDSQGEKRRVAQGALVSMAPDGAVRALIGGRNYSKSQFNRAVEAKRQPGSAFKPFVWLAALENGYTPSSVVHDVPVRFGKWKPENYDQKFRGPVTMAQALAKSINTVSASLAMEVGPKNVATVARRMGVNSKLTANASLSLGTSEVSLMEMTAAYAPFANGGLLAKPYLIKRITTEGGKVLYERDRTLPIEVIRSREIGMMNAMLGHVLESGTGRAAKLHNHPAGGKTGTSQNFRDALFVGHTAHLVTGVWFGNDNNKPTKKLTGGSLPAKVWKEFMTAAHLDLEPKDLPGAAIFVSALPENIPTPKHRPPLPVGNELADQTQTASLHQKLRDRVQAEVEKQAKRSILDLILGN